MKAYKISPPNIHPLRGMGPPAAGFSVPPASPASLPSVVLDKTRLVYVTVGLRFLCSNRNQNDNRLQTADCRLQTDRIEKRGSGVDSASLQWRDKACKISPPNIHPLTGMGPPAAGFFVPPASPASLPSVVLALCAGPILGPG